MSTLAVLDILLIDLGILALALLVGIALGQLSGRKYDFGVSQEMLRKRREQALTDSAWLRAIDPLVSAFASVVREMGFVGYRQRLARLLVYAGHPKGYTPEQFVGYQLTLATLTLVGMTLLVFVSGGGLAIWGPLLVAVFAFFFPYITLQTEADARRVNLDREIPYFLDLVALTMGAGATFLQACRSVLEGPRQGPLSEELRTMLEEERAGTPLGEALQRMTTRSNSEDLAGLVRAVRQGEELGTPMVDIFVMQASLSRFRRVKHGEEVAAGLPNRMALPTTFLMLSVLILLFGPIIVKATRGELM